MNPNKITRKIDIEISFYINQINEKIKTLSPYERYVSDNKEYINNNP